MSEKSAPSDGNKMSNEEALHTVETDRKYLRTGSGTSNGRG